MNAAPGPADYVLPVVSFQSPRLRLKIVSSYCLVFVLGLPLWWATTSIERLSLPAERVRSSASATELHFPLEVLIRPTIGDSPVSNSDIAGLAKQVGVSLEEERQEDQAAWQGLDVHIYDNVAHHANTEGSRYTVEIHPNSPSPAGDQPSLWLTDRSLHVRNISSSGDLSALSATISSALSGLLAPRTTHREGNSREQLVARYANKFRLAFSLLNEDASAGGAVVGWDLQAAVKQYLSPVLSQLGRLHNFTIESQVQFHAPLAFDPPRSLDESHYSLREEELKIFINSADWTLASSVSNDPVLHFILFVPSVSRRLLTVESSKGRRSDSFVVPQWGSVVILDPSTLRTKKMVSQQDGIHMSTSEMAGSFNVFRSQLLTLLGAPSLPPSVSISQSPFEATSGPLSDWQLDALLRRRALENTRDSKEALSSIVKLVDQIENMPVGQSVKGDVHGALDAIEQVYSSALYSPQSTLQHSARANTLSSRAFFNPGMLALLYFPAEHKYAVYIPLFAPVSVPLVVAVLREIALWRKERKLVRQKVD